MRWLMRIFFTLVLLAAWSVLGYFYFEHSLGSPKRTAPVQLEIKKGDSTMDIGHMLKEHNLVRNDWLFTIYSFLTGKAKGLKAGVYEVPPGMDIDGILAMITQGRQNTYRLTIPEGYTVEQIAETVAKQGKISKSDFIRAVDTVDYDYDFLEKIPKEKDRRHRLEGYLFPATYNVPKNADAKYIVNMMLGQFEQRLKEQGGLAQLKKKNISLDDWVIVASLVEREGQAKGEFPKIAGVIYNRLNKGMKLQVDASIQYALGEPKGRLLYKDLKRQSPYNTYLHKGLPPSSISNPGETALKAALNPDRHHYLYYVTKKDGSGEHYFAESYDEHRANIEKSKKTRAQNSGG
ncbi:endolytic transglycosylase MltG [Paludifilum halophilum]|nr:endolytic transglycosylase MltG [Paludifilum halophilum]